MARDYDRKAEQYDWRGPEVAFGLSYAFVSPGQSLLDIGIGTGLSSILFHKARLGVHGMDLSAEMLEAELVVGPEHTVSGSSAVMYHHSAEETKVLLKDSQFELVRCLEFPVPMDRERTEVICAKAYVGRRDGSRSSLPLRPAKSDAAFRTCDT